MTKRSRIVAEELLPQKEGDSEKERQLSEIEIALYQNKLRERALSQTSDSLGTIIKSKEAKEYITQFTLFQNLAWEVIDARINNDYQRIMNVAIKEISNGSGLHLNPQLIVPKHQQMTNIHLMPGGYLSDKGTEDILAGLRYVNYLNLLSKDIPFDSFYNNLVPRVKDEFIQSQFPNFNPTRILDLGCGIGHNTISLKNLYPDGQVMGVDLGAAMLRWGYGNGRLLHQEIEFYQQNAECTEFPNEHFDLVTSFLLLHEIPKTSMKRVIGECARILRTGGIMVHFDSGIFLDPQTREAKVMRDIQAPCNNEIFIVSPPLSTIQQMIHDSGMKPILAKVGDRNPLNNNLRRWQIVAGVKL